MYTYIDQRILLPHRRVKRRHL